MRRKKEEKKLKRVTRWEKVNSSAKVCKYAELFKSIAKYAKSIQGVHFFTTTKEKKKKRKKAKNSQHIEITIKVLGKYNTKKLEFYWKVPKTYLKTTR